MRDIATILPTGSARADDARSPTKQAMSKNAYELLKGRITSGALSGGDEIDLDVVATELGTSRTPVREALLRLETEGFIEIVPRHAIRVIPISLDDMAHMYGLVTALEVFAVELIARQPTELRDLTEIRQSVLDMSRAIEASDRSAWIDADERFHRGLLKQCNNPHITSVGLGYRDRQLRGHTIALRLRPQRATSIKAHADLVDLLASGDVASACANHRFQRDRAGKDLLESLAQAGLTKF